MKKSDLVGHWKLAWVNEQGHLRNPGTEKYTGVLHYDSNGTMHAAVLSLTGSGELLSGYAPQSSFTPMCQFRAGFYFAYCARYEFTPDPSDPRKGKITHKVKGASFKSPPQNHREVEIASDGSLLIEKILEEQPHQYWAWKKITAI